MELIPIYEMNDEEFDEFEELSEEEQEKYCKKLLNQETPNYLKEFNRLYMKYGELEFEMPEPQALINYGGKDWAIRTFFIEGLMTVKEYLNE